MPRDLDGRVYHIRHPEEEERWAEEDAAREQARQVAEALAHPEESEYIPRPEHEDPPGRCIDCERVITQGLR